MSATFRSFFIKSFYISFSPIVFNSIHRLRKVKNLFDSTAHKRWKIQSAIKIFLQIRVFIYTFYFRKFSKFLKINLVFFFIIETILRSYWKKWNFQLSNC